MLFVQFDFGPMFWQRRVEVDPKVASKYRVEPPMFNLISPKFSKSNKDELEVIFGDRVRLPQVTPFTRLQVYEI